MDIYAHAQSNPQSWAQGTPLPPPERDTSTRPQRWHQFDPAAKQWVPLPTTNSNDQSTSPQTDTGPSPGLVLVTWNIDGASPHTQQRVADIIAFVTRLDPNPGIVFFQEVSKTALQVILSDERIRDSWISSEAGDRAWGHEPFTTMTLISKTCIARPGPIWRVSYPSYFNRDALFCDLFVPGGQDPPSSSSPSSSLSKTRLRLANVHLDSLALQPSNRPRQLSILASYLRSAGTGVVAGDFNPVLPGDDDLVERNGLVDVWEVLRPGESGFTWGADGRQRFPPRRMDKVVGVGVEGGRIAVLDAGRVGGGDGDGEGAPWSDHHGLVCSFRVRGG